MFDDPGILTSKWQQAHPERNFKRKVFYLKQSTFYHWNLKRLLSNKEDRPYTNDDLTSSLIELYNKWLVGHAHGHGRQNGSQMTSYLYLYYVKWQMERRWESAVRIMMLLVHHQLNKKCVSIIHISSNRLSRLSFIAIYLYRPRQA